MDTSQLAQQVTSIIGQLHTIFDEIGVPHHEREARESELFSSLSETLYNHLRQVSSEKNNLIDEGQQIIETIKQIEKSLDDPKTRMSYAPHDEELEVTYPLTESLQSLREKHRIVTKLHLERFDQVRKLIEALESYSSHLEPSFLQIKLPKIPAGGNAPPPTFDLSPSYINSVDSEFTRVYEEYTKRVATVQQYAHEIINLWAELGTPQAQTDSHIVQCWQESPEQLGLHQDDVYKLRARRERLQEEKRSRERKVKDLRTAVEGLWDRLGIDESERKSFLASRRGCGLRVINDLEDELSRLNELKRQNLHLFVEDARTRINALWEELFFSEEEAVEFTPMFCDVYSDALLSAHESEISRLETLKEQRAPMLNMISKHRSLVHDRDELANTSQDASRLIAKKGEKRDPTRLLREEKMRKRIARDLPKVEAEVSKALEQWEDEFGRPFLVFGERYLDVIEESSASRAKAAPSRSKTPSVMGPPPKTIKSAPQASRAGTMSRDTSLIRSKTPVEGHGTMSRNAGNAFTASRPPAKDQQKSPTRIPGRAPLGNMPHGSNSPERHPQNARGRTHDQENFSRTIRPGSKPNPNLMAPPPKMRDLASLHDQPPSVSTPSIYSPSEADSVRSGSVIRSTIPEDPYNDNLHSSFMSRSQQTRPQTSHPYMHQTSNLDDYRAMPPPPPRPAYSRANTDTDSLASTSMSRQLSANSSVAGSIATTNTGATSCSENWETFGESDAEDDDATPGPQKPHWAANNKRLHAVGMETAYGRGGLSAAQAYASKKVRMGDATVMEEKEGRLVSGGSDGWTDESESVY
ncbi:MAG: hypothetical protein Q9162_005658 [Coniocarpon cinnabarinum]